MRQQSVASLQHQLLMVYLFNNPFQPRRIDAGAEQIDILAIRGLTVAVIQ
jgi:hypothetical protein